MQLKTKKIIARETIIFIISVCVILAIIGIARLMYSSEFLKEYGFRLWRHYEEYIILLGVLNLHLHYVLHSAKLLRNQMVYYNFKG
ncbi:MAG: hypothetical protein U5K00_12205 [Melioribacteraceae bacterium]|nr:hypothetical protein [Melioribacteraceae bacterium]